MVFQILGHCKYSKFKLCKEPTERNKIASQENQSKAKINHIITEVYLKFKVWGDCFVLFFTRNTDIS